MSDRREEILKSYGQPKVEHSDCYYSDDVKDAMDEYMKECCLELLEYLAKNDVKCMYIEGSNCEIICSFYFKGERLTKEQLFENFL